MNGIIKTLSSNLETIQVSVFIIMIRHFYSDFCPYNKAREKKQIGILKRKRVNDGYL